MFESGSNGFYSLDFGQSTESAAGYPESLEAQFRKLTLQVTVVGKHLLDGRSRERRQIGGQLDRRFSPVVGYFRSAQAGKHLDQIRYRARTVWLKRIREDANGFGKGGVASTGIVLHVRLRCKPTQYIADNNSCCCRIGIGCGRPLLHSWSILAFKSVVKRRYCSCMSRRPIFCVFFLLYTGTRVERAAETPVP